MLLFTAMAVSAVQADLLPVLIAEDVGCTGIIPLLLRSQLHALGLWPCKNSAFLLPSLIAQAVGSTSMIPLLLRVHFHAPGLAVLVACLVSKQFRRDGRIFFPPSRPPSLSACPRIRVLGFSLRGYSLAASSPLKVLRSQRDYG